MILGLEELILRCPDEVGRANIREAVKCYEAGAYRAAIMTTYVAVCYDLIEKLKVLASSGDGEANIITANLLQMHEQQARNDPSAIGRILEFERNLLETFRDKFEFFGVHEFEDMRRLRHDRNRCAHPTFLSSNQPYSPSAELARFHMVNALGTVLTQAPRQGKAALTSLRAIILSNNFPSELDDAIERLRNSELASARPALVRAFVDEVAFGWPDPNSPYYQQLGAMYGILAAVELHRPLATERAQLVMEKLLARHEPKALEMGSAIAVRVLDVGENASASAKIVMKSWVQTNDSPMRAFALRSCLKLSWLREAAEQAASNLSAEEISKMSGDYPEVIITRAARLIADCSTTAELDDTIRLFRNEIFDRFNETDIAAVVEGASKRKIQFFGSSGFLLFVRRVSEHSPEKKAILDRALMEASLPFFIRADGAKEEISPETMPRD